jgi:flagellin
MRINHNMTAMNTYRQLSMNEAAQSKTMQQLSTGKRINGAADDAAGLAISEKMKAQIRGLDQASRNSQDGISMIQTADSALDQSTQVLQRMRELAVQSASDTNTAQDRTNIQKEFSQLRSQVDDIANNTDFNGTKLLTGNIGLKTNDPTNIAQLSMTSDTKAGTLTLGADITLAQAATGHLDIATANQTTASADGTLNITANGNTYNIGFTNGETYDDIAKNITSTVKGLTATWDGTAGQIKFTSNDANSDQVFTVEEATANTLDAGADFTSATGTDNIDTSTALNGTTSTNASGLGAGYSYYGNEVTVTSGNFTGLSFTAVADAGSTTTASTNGKTIDVGNQLALQTGANKGQNLSININAMDSTSLGISGLDVTTQAGAANAITALDNAVNTVSSERAKLGAYQNRLEYTTNNLDTTSQNLSAAQSRIEDVDMAKAVMENSKNGILAQAAQAMLGQANQQPQGVLQLLRG